MATDPLHMTPETWRALDTEKRRLLRPSGLSLEEKLRRRQRLSAQAAALRRSIIRDEPARAGARDLPIDPLPGIDS